MNAPNPALVPERAAARLPRLPLWLLCAAYLVPGVIGRDPWRNADVTSYAVMLGLAEGRASWWAPTLGGLPADAAWLPHWLGAWAIQGAGAWLGPDLAVRIPFTALLGLTLALVWYTTFHLARTPAAQPVRFAFGGEAQPVDYARALADGALLAFMACLGLLQLGHETTPELVQLSLVALLFWGLAAAPQQPRWAWAAVLTAPLLLALSGAPAVGLGLTGAALLACGLSHAADRRALCVPLALAWVGSAGLSSVAHTWVWRVALPDQAHELLSLVTLLAWFTWPVWPLAVWTIWKWRRQWRQAHILLPLAMGLPALLACVAMGGSDRALLLALPAMAALTAFALPTLNRSASAAIDWFSVFFFSLAALAVWITYSSVQWQLPAKPLANIMRLAPGFSPSFNALELGAAVLATAAWIYLVRWRTARHRHPLWKSLVLPASGVALSWLLTMTLLLPVLDYARSPRAVFSQVVRHTQAQGGCVLAAALPRPHLAALEVFGHQPVQALASWQDIPAAAQAPCASLVLQTRQPAQPPVLDGWRLAARVRRPTERNEVTWVYTR
ncbi:hypothetical protein [Ideonella livida]|uniref:Glycosyltransferase n=1 Tax=Ideonella livida TaxID=2707176 RepID=A0A7C9PE78_9BURK|nr:hypothetical protein [Ideonella livida]NDY89597.1 hypothetical protein [Ideonella livida]